MMQSGWIRETAMGILVGAAPWAWAQSGVPSRPSLTPSRVATPPPSTQRFLMASSSPAATLAMKPAGAGGQAAGAVVKEIDDPGNGNRWLLTSDPGHPGGPGLLRLAAAVTGEPASEALAGDQHPSLRAGEPAQAALRPRPDRSAPVPLDVNLPIVHSGDRIILEQHSRLVDARLEAVAIGPARAGAAFSARLLMGGGLVRAVALSAGRARFAEESER